MISELLRRYVAGPIAKVLGFIPYEPVQLAAAVIATVTFLRDQLSGGADIETAITATLIMVGGQLVRAHVWPAVKIDAETAKPVEVLGEPITGLDD